jgi:hypothetical protein
MSDDPGTSRPVPTRLHRLRSAPAWIAVILATLTVFGPLSMDLYLPVLPNLADDLRTTTSAAQLTMTTCLLGLAFGQVVAGPLSDRYVGGAQSWSVCSSTPPGRVSPNPTATTAVTMTPMSVRMTKKPRHARIVQQAEDYERLDRGAEWCSQGSLRGQQASNDRCHDRRIRNLRLPRR